MSDLISRAEAIEAVWRAITSDELVQGSVEEEILKLPSAERSGEWIKRGTKISCSNCKSSWSTSFDLIIAGMHFCPNCGARMYKGGDDE